MKNKNVPPQNAFVEETIHRFSSGTFAPETDALICEIPLSLVVDGMEISSAVITPGHEKLWAVGHLTCCGLIENKGDIKNIHVEPGYVFVERTRVLPEPPPISSKKPLAITWRTTPQALFSGIEWLAEGPLFKHTGCTHVAALLTPEGEKLFLTEDTGRHNAIDKAVGWAIHNDRARQNLMLILSGRLPQDMTAKAIGAGIPLMASISAATEQGVHAARSANLTLIGFARNGKMNVYSAPERLWLEKGT